MKALILAAGTGVRMGKITGDIPKALLNVSEIPLLDHVLNFVEHPAITRIGVVGGYCFEQIKEYLKGKDIDLFFNDRYRYGNIFTLKAAFDFIDDDFLLLNVDHIYPKELLGHVLKNSRGITAMCDFDRKLSHDDMKVKLDSSGRMQKISKQLDDFDGGYIGMTYCAREMNSQYKEAVLETLRVQGETACVEFVLGNLADNGADVYICDTSGFRWNEVDTPEDLKLAETHGKNGGQS